MTKPSIEFPHFLLEGSPRELGRRAVELYGERILECYRFYLDLFASLLKVNLSLPGVLPELERQIVSALDTHTDAIKSRVPLQYEELTSIAASLGEPLWRILFLNCRSELYNRFRLLKPDSQECTSFYFPNARILGQNWDWHPKLEDLAVTLEVRADAGTTFFMFTEPGIIGKIGFNQFGLGVGLNILFASGAGTGLPIHLLLRAALECENVEAAERRIHDLPRMTASNILLGDKHGACADLELKAGEVIKLPFSDGRIIHTNHYYGEDVRDLPNSAARLKRASELYSHHSTQGIDGAKTLLGDRESGPYPICRAYEQGVDFLVGTVAGLIFDLPNRRAVIAKGPPQPGVEWYERSLA